VEIVARKLDFSYGAKQVLWDVSVVAVSGSRLGVIGESGSGKTTLARLLAGALASPLVTVDGQPWSRHKRSGNVRRSVQMIHQDPFASLSQHMSALSAVREAVQVCRKLPRREAGLVAGELLESVGVGGQLSARRPESLSGGQCQRVAIARALAAEPAIIVADEPTSALDLSVQAQIINVLLQVMAERSTGLVLVSHDLAVIRHLTDEVVVMQHGRIVESGATADVLNRPRHPYTRTLCAAARAGGSSG
jgi:peptide/nickel transport system ATP-binding protein